MKQSSQQLQNRTFKIFQWMFKIVMHIKTIILVVFSMIETLILFIH